MTEEPKHYLVQRIREALAHDPRVAEMELQVTVRGAKVFVSGVVSTEERCRAIEEVVREKAPELELHNEVEVAVPPSPRPGSEERVS